jgi:SAM-dependent methyltransferase
MLSEQHSVPKTTFFGLLLLSAATLLLELTLARLLSVTLWYHFAFMVISTALFGLGFAGVVLSLKKQADQISSNLVAGAALGTPLSFVGGYLLFNLVPFEPFSLGIDSWQWLYLGLSYLSVTLPFFFAGLTIAALLTRYADYVHQLYLFDLVGAGLGCFLIVFFLPWLGGPATVVAAAVLAACGAGLIVWPKGGRWIYCAFGLGLALLVLVFFADDWIGLRISSNKVTGQGVLVSELLKNPRFHRHTAYNTLSRIDVIEYRDKKNQPHRSVLIDAGTAVTRLAHPAGPLDTLGPTNDEEGFFVRRYDRPQVLVIGSGGGREVLLALRNGAARIVAVEINEAINQLMLELMTDFTGNLYRHPKVVAITDEARSYLRRSDERFDLIHCPHTISNAALSSGSLSLAENHLLTVEAFEDYLDHMADDGSLLITRPEAHLPRLLSTLRQVFERRSWTGLENKVMLYRSPGQRLSFYAGLVFSKKAFSVEETDAFADVLERRKLEGLYLPGRVAKDPYQGIIKSDKPLEVKLYFTSILEPATDDKPFFNQRVPISDIGWSDLVAVFSPGTDGRMALEDRPVAESSLIALLLEVVLVALFLIVLPLMIFKRRDSKGGSVLELLKVLGVFFALGLGYIVVEVGFIQRFTLYLGRPVVVLSTVLGSMLIFSGLGSAYSKKYFSNAAPMKACWLAAGIAVVSALIIPAVVQWTLFWPLGFRVLMTIVLLLPVGFVMGMPFPLHIKRLKGSRPQRIPWAWGVNGFASVTGSIGAVILGMTAGYTFVLLFGVVCYMLAAVCSWERQTKGT